MGNKMQVHSQQHTMYPYGRLVVNHRRAANVNNTLFHFVSIYDDVDEMRYA